MEQPNLAQQGRIQMQSNRLGDALDVLDSTVANLIDRIKPALGPSNPEKDGEGDGIMTQSDLADWLSEKSRQVERLTSVVRDVTDRVEF